MSLVLGKMGDRDVCRPNRKEDFGPRGGICGVGEDCPRRTMQQLHGRESDRNWTCDGQFSRTRLQSEERLGLALLGQSGESIAGIR